MYLCRKSEPGKWSVGSLNAEGRWIEESSWNSAAEASEHLHTLNVDSRKDQTPKTVL